MDDKTMLELAARKPFYFGVRPCGCHTASLVDDKETTAAEVADFARRMAKSDRRVVHKEVTRNEFMELMQSCPHKTGQMELAAAEIGKGMGVGE